MGVIMGIHHSFLDSNNADMYMHKRIMDIHNCIMDIHN